MRECQFCGQEHESNGEFLGIQITPCPNIPKGWLALGPDVHGDLIVAEVEPGRNIDSERGAE